MFGVCGNTLTFCRLGGNLSNQKAEVVGYRNASRGSAVGRLMLARQRQAFILDRVRESVSLTSSASSASPT